MLDFYLKNEENRIFVNLKNYPKIDNEKFAIHTFVSKTFYKKYSHLKINTKMLNSIKIGL